MIFLAVRPLVSTSFFVKVFSLSGFSFTDTGDSQGSMGKEGTDFLFLSTTSARSSTFRCLFETLHLR